MNLDPALRSLLPRPPGKVIRHPASFLLLETQVALTLALVVNAALIVRHELGLIHRPSGLDESHIFVVETRPASGAPLGIAAVNADLAALRRMPEAVSATRINTLPLGDGGWRTAVATMPFGEGNPAHDHAALFFSDEKGPQTLGLRLVTGRGFTSQDVRDIDSFTWKNGPSVAIVSRSLASVLFPNQDPIGQRIYSRVMDPLTVIGVVDHLQSSWPSWDKHEQSMLLPARLNALPNALYLVRIRGTAMAQAMDDAVGRLVAVDGERMIAQPRPYDAVHVEGYRDEQALADLLIAMIAALLLVTALGIAGTASFWVSSRTRLIGIRRALGATRADIVRYFLGENLLITATGVVAGSALALWLNQWLVGHYEVPALHWGVAPIGGLVLILLGQASVLGPALRAARVPPVVATKNL